MFYYSALLPWRIEEEINVFHKKFIDKNSESLARSHNPRDETEHHQTFFIHLQ